LLTETKGAIPNSYMQALKDTLKLTHEVEQIKTLAHENKKVAEE